MSMTLTPRKPMTICGFCNNHDHEHCPHAIRNGNKGLWFCACAGPNCGGKILSCIDCKKVHDDVLPDTRTCVDKDACTARIEARRNNDPFFQRVVRAEERAKMTKQAENTEKREKVAKEADCSCGCGGKTKGGKFLPGHDARFVSEQVGHVLGKNKKEDVARAEVAAISEALGAKFDKSLSINRAKAEKAAADTKAKADKAEADKAEKAKAAADAKAAKAAEKAAATA